jgi:riboflavin synthase
MFTGITRGTFPVAQVERAPGLLRYAVALDVALREGLAIGASVSIDGVCQTVVSIQGQEVWFEAIRETLERTTLDTLQPGQRVSVERSFRVGDEIGGHTVAGHVIGTGTVQQVRREGHDAGLRIAIPASWMKYVMAKGFIAVDGSSLTVGDTDRSGWFDVHLVPETLRLTNLGNKCAGDRVNIELDPQTVAIVDTVERVLAERER